MAVPETMQAVRVHGVEDYRLETIPVPSVGPGEVLVRVLATGVCASDVKAYHGSRVWGSDEIAPYIQPPVTPGHEFVGEVVALGEGAGERDGLQVGDWAISEQIIPCGECRYCRRGQYWMCQRHDIYGFIKDRAEGSWAEYMKFPAGALNYRVPQDVPAEQAALIEPMACAIHAVQRATIELGDTVVVSGCGPLGLGMVAAARLKNPARLIALDLRPERLTVAAHCGADLVFNPRETDVIAEVLDLTDGYGCDVYIEATGHPSSVVQGLHMIRRLGTMVEFSVFGEPVTVDWTIIGDTK